MRLEIHRGAARLQSLDEYPYSSMVIERAFHAYASRLGIDGADAKVDLLIKDPRSMPTTAGAVTQGKIHKNCFYMQLRDTALIKCLPVLAHEMIHVKQYIRGEIGHSPDGGVVVHGRAIDHLEYTTRHPMDFEHEAEAYGEMFSLVHEVFPTLPGAMGPGMQNELLHVLNTDREMKSIQDTRDRKHDPRARAGIGDLLIDILFGGRS